MRSDAFDPTPMAPALPAPGGTVQRWRSGPGGVLLGFRFEAQLSSLVEDHLARMGEAARTPPLPEVEPLSLVRAGVLYYPLGAHALLAEQVTTWPGTEHAYAWVPAAARLLDSVHHAASSIHVAGHLHPWRIGIVARGLSLEVHLFGYGLRTFDVDLWRDHEHGQLPPFRRFSGEKAALGLRYAPLERLERPQEALGPASDVFSLGLIAAELWFGVPLLSGRFTSLAEARAAHVALQSDARLAALSGPPAVLRELLRLDPGDRPGLAELEPLFGRGVGAPVAPAVVPVSAPASPAPPPRPAAVPPPPTETPEGAGVSRVALPICRALHEESEARSLALVVAFARARHWPQVPREWVVTLRKHLHAPSRVTLARAPHDDPQLVLVNAYVLLELDERDEARSLLEATATPVDPWIRAVHATWWGRIALGRGDVREVRVHLRQAAHHFRMAGDPEGEALANYWYAEVAAVDDPDGGVRPLEEAVARVADPAVTLRGLLKRAELRFVTGAEAASLENELIELVRRAEGLGSATTLARAHALLGMVHLCGGETARAQVQLDDALALASSSRTRRTVQLWRAVFRLVTSRGYARVLEELEPLGEDPLARAIRVVAQRARPPRDDPQAELLVRALEDWRARVTDGRVSAALSALDTDVDKTVSVAVRVVLACPQRPLRDD